MEWTAQTFIQRVVRPKAMGQPWRAELAGEVKQGRPPGRYLVDTLTAELAGDIPDIRKSARQLFFFSSHAGTAVDGRAGPVGVEEKCTDLSFPSIIDGAIHRGIAWVSGNPQGLSKPEAVSLCVVRRGAHPMLPALSDALASVLGSVATFGIHVVFVHGETGQHWMVDGVSDIPMPRWLAEKAVPESWRLQLADEQAMRQIDSLDGKAGRRCRLFGRMNYEEYDGDGGAKLARVEWSNHWQMIEVGLLLRAAGYDAAKAVYRGSHPLGKAGRGVERNIQALMAQRFGVVLDWGVPL